MDTMTMLTARRELFCQEYVVDRNAKQAAIRAGYSEATAKQQGSRLLTYADVQARVAELQEEAAKRNEVTVDSVIANLVELRDAAKAKGQLSAAVRAQELIGKTCAAFVDVQRDDSSKMTNEAMAAVLGAHLGEDATATLMQKLRDSDPSVKTVH